MPPRLRVADPAEVRVALDRLRAGDPDRADLRLLVKHFLAVLEERAPGHSVEVRVPPYAAVQVVPGVRHTRGTPPAVVETDAATWIALATGELTWPAALDAARVTASGERTDLSAYLPLHRPHRDSARRSARRFRVASVPNVSHYRGGGRGRGG